MNPCYNLHGYKMLNSLESFIQFDTTKFGWSIIYFEGSQIINFELHKLVSLKIGFILANIVDCNEHADTRTEITLLE